MEKFVALFDMHWGYERDGSRHKVPLHDQKAISVAMQFIEDFKPDHVILGGDTLYILEVHPAGYATIAANEAEKASPISLIEMQMFGAYGRLYLGGTEARIAEAAAAVLNALERIEGRPNK